jgi:hypothetical protein
LAIVSGTLDVDLRAGAAHAFGDCLRHLLDMAIEEQPPVPRIYCMAMVDTLSAQAVSMFLKV